MLFMSLVTLNTINNYHILYNQNNIIIHTYTIQIKKNIIKYFTNKYYIPKFQYFKITNNT